MKKVHFLHFAFILGWFGTATAQYDTATKRIEVQLSARVDTSDEEEMAVVNLYENYLNSRPDSVYDNPYWNSREKEKYEVFDLSVGPIYQGNKTPDRLFFSYMPYVLSVEKIEEKYRIRVLFVNKTKAPPYVGSKVWAVHKLSVVQEEGKWVLENLIVDLKDHWGSQEFGKILYRYPPGFELDSARAEKAKAFCDNMIERFNLQFDGRFTYYLANSLEKAGLVMNLEYGVTLAPMKVGKHGVMSYKGDEFYPHEFVHILLPKNERRGAVIEEGLASFLGSKMRPEKYRKEKMAPMAKDLAQGVEKIAFEKVVSQKVRWNGYQTVYPAGAAICEVVHNEKGDAGIQKLIEGNTSSYKATLESVTQITGLNEAGFKKAWRSVFDQYR